MPGSTMQSRMQSESRSVREAALRHMLSQQDVRTISAGSRLETHAVAAGCADDLVHPRNLLGRPACFEPRYYRVRSPDELFSCLGLGLLDRHVFALVVRRALRPQAGVL